MEMALVGKVSRVLGVMIGGGSLLHPVMSADKKFAVDESLAKLLKNYLHTSSKSPQRQSLGMSKYQGLSLLLSLQVRWRSSLEN